MKVYRLPSGRWSLRSPMFMDPTNGKTFPNAAEARRHAWKVFGVVPTIDVPDASPLDMNDAVHRAIVAIEARESPHEVVLVGPKHYYIRRSRLSPEVAVRYSVHKGMVHARNDTEVIK